MLYKMKLVSLLSFFLFLSLCGKAVSVQILSERSDVIIKNSRLYRNTTLELSCSNADFGSPTVLTIQKSNGDVSLVTVTCVGIKYLYEKVTIAYVPYKGKRFSSVVCETRGGPELSITEPERFERTNVSVAGNVTVDDTSVPSHNFSIFNAFYDANQHVPEGSGDQHHHYLMSNAHGPHHSVMKPMCGPACGIGIAASLGLSIYATYSSMTSRTQADERLRADMLAKLSDFSKDITEIKQAKDAFVSSFTSYLDGVWDQANQTSANIKLLNNTIGNQQQQLVNLDSSVNLLDASLSNFKNSTNLKLNQTEKRVLELQQQMAATNLNIAALSGALQDEVQFLLGAMSNNSQDLSKRMQEGFAGTREALDILQMKILAVTSGVRDITSIVYQMRERTQMKNTLASRVQTDLNAALAEDLNPFLDDFGKLPQSGSSSWYVLMDLYRTIYTVTQQGQPRIVMRTVGWYCSARYVLNMRPWTDFPGVMSLLGPRSCDPLVADNCTCYFEQRVTECLAKPAAISQGTWRNATVLDSVLCAGVAVTSPLEYVLDIEQFMAVLTETCVEGPTSSISLSSAVLQVRGDLVMRNASCSLTINAVLAYSPPDYLYMFVQLLIQSHQTLYTLAPTMFPELMGVLPRHIKMEDRPYERINSVDATCTSASFVAFSPQMVKVSKLIPRDVVSQVKVKIDNGPEQLITNGQIIVPDDYILPQEQFIVGGLTSDVVYDVPYSEIGMSPVFSSNRGKIGYVRSGTPQSFSLGSWLNASAGMEFEPLDALNLPWLYERPLNQEGVCQGDARSYQGSVCNVLERFQVVATSNYYDKTTASYGVQEAQTIVLKPRASSTTLNFQVVVPDGMVTRVFFSACPLTQMLNSSASWRTLTMTNPDGVNQILVDVVTEVTGVPDCVQNFPNVVIGPASTVQLKLTVCEMNGIPYDKTVVVFYRDELNRPVLCESSTIASNRTAFYQETNVADVRFVHETSTFLADTMGFQVYRLMQSLSQLTLDLNAELRKVTLEVGGADLVARLNNSKYDSIRELALSIASNATQNMNDTRNTIGAPPDPADEEYRRKFNELQARNVQLRREQEALQQELNTGIVRGDYFTIKLANQTEDLKNKTVRLGDAIEALANSSLALQESLVENILAGTGRKNFFAALGDAIQEGGEGVGSLVSSLGGALSKNLFGFLGIPGDIMSKLFAPIIGIVVIVVFVIICIALFKYGKKWNDICRRKQRSSTSYKPPAYERVPTTDPK